MKFRCERDALVDQLTASSRAVSNRGGALPVLTGVFLSVENDMLTIIGSDLDLTVRASLPVTVINAGKAVVPARLTCHFLLIKIHLSVLEEHHHDY